MSDVIEIDADVTETEYLTADVATTESIDADVTESVGGGGGTTDYEVLVNKPQINGVTLVGNKTSADLGIESGDAFANFKIGSETVSAESADDTFEFTVGSHMQMAKSGKGIRFDTYNVAPQSHAAINTMYGAGDEDNYGHLKLKHNLVDAASGDHTAISTYGAKIIRDNLQSQIDDCVDEMVTRSSQFGFGYMVAIDDSAGSSLNEGKSYTARDLYGWGKFELTNGGIIAVKFPTNVKQRQTAPQTYAPPLLRINTGDVSHTDYVGIYYNGEIIPSNQIKANDVALLVYDEANERFEHVGFTNVGQYTTTTAGLVPACGSLIYEPYWKILTTSGWKYYDDSIFPWALNNSPALTGVPTAPTAASGTDTTQIATTAFVKDAVQDVVNGTRGQIGLLPNGDIDDFATDKIYGTYYLNNSDSDITGTKPDTAGQGLLFCKQQSSAIYRQIYIGVASSSAMKVRYYYNNAWTQWNDLPIRTEIDSRVASAATGTAGKITSLLLSKDSVGYYISVWSTDDPSARRGYFRLDADAKTTSSITAEGGWTLGDLRTCAKVGSTVVFDYWCSYSGTPTIRQWITIGTIPSGYRPTYAYDMVAVDNSGVTSGVQTKVEASGAIKVYLMDDRSKGLRIHGVHFA